MMTSFRKSLREEEAGQAIILGVATMLVMAVAVMTTAQLGWAIKSKIQLQHAADNAAYSNAVMVARSMNFIAWTNRAMVSQYVSAMAFQSMMTHVDSWIMLLASIAATVLSFSFTLGVAGKILSVIPFTAPVGALMTEAASLLGKAGELIETAVDNINKVVQLLDIPIAGMVWAIGGLNELLYGFQQVAGKGYVAMNFLSAGFGQSSVYTTAIEETAGLLNDDGGDSGNAKTIYNAISNAISGISFADLFDSTSNDIDDTESGIKTDDGGQNPSDAVMTIRAEALMTEIVNASREGRAGVKFESFREQTLTGGISFKTIIKLFGSESSASGDANPDSALSKALNLFGSFFPKGVGGALIANRLTKEEEVGSDGGFLGIQTDDNAKKNPIFSNGKYRSTNKLSRGRALLTAQYTVPPGGKFGDILGKALNILGGGGETMPAPKMVGIQATDKRNYKTKAWHCRYGGLGFGFESTASSACDKICEESMNECNSNCEKNVCPSGFETTEEDGSPGCSTDLVWGPKAGSSYENCGSCGSAEGDDDGDCEAAQECKEAMKEVMQEAEAAASDAISGVFGGRPSQVTVSCTTHSSEGTKGSGGSGSAAVPHRFPGITPYVSFNIKDFNKKQEEHKQAIYPTFFAAAFKKPSFMKKGALGFGDNFSSSKKFKISTMGKVGGLQMTDDIYKADDLMKDMGSVDGYNFNYLNDSNGDVKFLGSAGFHAWASSEIYYHRPGTWVEPPNLFNPYWKAKLAPVSNMMDSILGAVKLPLSGQITKVLSSVMTH